MPGWKVGWSDQVSEPWSGGKKIWDSALDLLLTPYMILGLLPHKQNLVDTKASVADWFL